MPELGKCSRIAESSHVYQVASALLPLNEDTLVMADPPLSASRSRASTMNSSVGELGQQPLSFKKRRPSSARPSFGSIMRRFSLSRSSIRTGGHIPDDDSVIFSQLGHQHSHLPQLIPNDIQPLPLLPLICLCLAMLAEFLSASTPAAFLFFQVQSFYVPEGETSPPPGVESKIAFQVGIVGSIFFLSQFLVRSFAIVFSF